jgi:uncharacterized membrane protein YgdD (TMEM256/DUF423 family)
MDNVLQTALAEVVNSLASFFGTTTEAIMAHAPEFLAKYGWYSTLNELPITIMGIVLITGVLCLMGSLILMACDGELKHPLLTVVGIFIFCLIIGVGIKIVTCAVAPEIVGAHAILDLLKNAK